MSDLLRGTILLTGATGGIGHAVARALGARGADLVLTGRRADVLEPLASELGASAVAADLADRAAVERLVAGLGPVDVLVANAALPASGLLEDYSIADIDRALDVNLRAPIVLARLLLPGMIERGRGHLVFMSSLSGKSAQTYSSLYSATKFGLRGFALGVRSDLHGRGVGVSTIFPGFISDAGMFADSGVRLQRGIGTRRPEQVADAVIRAIRHDRAEISVAPLPLRLGASLAGLAPDLSLRVGRGFGGRKLAGEIAAGQQEKR